MSDYTTMTNDELRVAIAERKRVVLGDHARPQIALLGTKGVAYVCVLATTPQSSQ
jgi:hypothetical protein